MTTDLIPLNIQVPAHLADRIGKPSALGDSLGGGISSGASHPRISIKGSRFRLIDDGTESVLDTTSLEVIIVGANAGLSKAWYASAWNPDAEPSAPDCYSLEGDKPHPDSTQPQNDICTGCPQNAWGSRITPQGTKVKACSDKKRLAVVSADDAGGPIYLMEVTASALKGLNQFNTNLKQRGIPAEVVRTNISFDTDASYPKLKFGFGGLLDEGTQALVDPLFGSEVVKEITGEVAATAAASPVAAPVAAVAPPVVEQPVAEPVADKKATGFGAATVVVGAKPPEAPAAVVVEEPAAAPAVAPAAAAESAAAAGTAGLAAEITKMMAEVADDA